MCQTVDPELLVPNMQLSVPKKIAILRINHTLNSLYIDNNNHFLITFLANIFFQNG